MSWVIFQLLGAKNAVGSVLTIRAERNVQGDDCRTISPGAYYTYARGGRRNEYIESAKSDAFRAYYTLYEYARGGGGMGGDPGKVQTPAVLTIRTRRNATSEGPLRRYGCAHYTRAEE